MKQVVRSYKLPLYEYRCTQCDHKFEKIQGYDAPEAMDCPLCKGEAVRMISRAAVQFKGSGFYSTDYGARLGSAASEKSMDGSADSSGDSATLTNKGASDGKPGEGKSGESKTVEAKTPKTASSSDGGGESSSAPAATASAPASIAAPVAAPAAKKD